MAETNALEGKRVLITGGGTGIGRGCALALAAEGAKVLVAGRREDKLIETAGLSKHPISTHVVDVANGQSVAELFDHTVKTLGGLDILVNCSGVNVRNRSMAALTFEDWQTMLDINASGAFHCMAAALPIMRSQKDGLIVNICSVAGKRANTLAGVGYSASKFAMNALTMTAALEEGKNGIRITAIHPGEVNTPILDNRPNPVGEAHRAQILQAEDVAAAVVMIAKLPPRAHVSELVIKPTSQDFA